MWAEHALVERGGDLVVLRVRGVGVDRYVGRAQSGDERAAIATLLVAQAQRAYGANARAQQRLGHDTGFDETLDHGRSIQARADGGAYDCRILARWLIVLGMVVPRAVLADAPGTEALG